jgi:hypothetical protein
VSVPALLATELRHDSARPFLTWYDDATGERIELSIATLANWAAKTANLLVDEHAIEAGDPVRLLPANHWLTVVAALGAWTAGACIDLDADGDVSVPGDAASFIAAVLPQPDALLAPPVAPTTAALRANGREWTAQELATAASNAATGHGVSRGARIMSTLSLDSVDGMDATLLVPLAGGGSVVWSVNADATRLAARAATERVTHTAGCDVEGLPRLD